MTSIGEQPRRTDEELMALLDRPRKLLRAAALSIAESRGLVLDDIEREALELIEGELNLEALIVALAYADGPEDAKEAWTGFFRSCANNKDYRLAVEVRRFIKQRQQATGASSPVR